MASDRPTGSTSEVVLVNLGPGGVHDGVLHWESVIGTKCKEYRGVARRRIVGGAALEVHRCARIWRKS